MIDNIQTNAIVQGSNRLTRTKRLFAWLSKSHFQVIARARECRTMQRNRLAGGASQCMQLVHHASRHAVCDVQGVSDVVLRQELPSFLSNLPL